MKIQPVLALIFSASFSCGTAHAADLNNTVSIKIEAYQETIIIGEPLFVELQFSNNSPNPVLLYRSGRQPGWIVVSTPAQETIVLRESDVVYRLGPLKLEPGQKLDQQRLVFCTLTRKGFEPIFPKQGEYRIQGVYGDSLGTDLQSPVVRILVKEPEGGELRHWGQLSGNTAYCSVLQDPSSEVDENAIQSLVKFVRTNVDSRYAPYVAWGLGRHYRIRSQPDLAEAAKYFEAASKMDQVPFVQDESTLLWVETMAFLGDPRKVRQTVDEILQKRPDHPHKDRLAQLRSRALDARSHKELLADLLKELDAEGFEVSGFPGPHLLEFAERQRPIEKLMGEGKITPEQYDRMYYELVKSFLKKKSPATAPEAQ